jgi:phosphatidylinositol alpha-1,6-mannosyltransferase
VVIANSRATREIVLRYKVWSECVHVVYPPSSWDPSEIAEQAETTLAERYQLAGKRVLLVAGRLVLRKGVDVAIDAARMLRKKFPNLLLVVVGDGPEMDRLRTSAGDLSDAVIFTGPLGEPEMRDAYRAAEIALYPSRDMLGDFEGYGIGAADAGLFGKPVVASRLGGLTEAVEDGVTGLLVPPEDPNGLAAAIQSLLENSGRSQAMGERGRERAQLRNHRKFREEFFSALAA